jgi:uncharacterized protein with NRDE domain
MCTVVFIPENDKFYFASLRDESPLRSKALIPEINISNEVHYLSPKDSKEGGTWVGVNNLGIVIILLNGGLRKHKRKDYYRKSRGLIVNELLSSDMPLVDWSLLRLEDIEPFTLVVFDKNNLFQLVWDGTQRIKTQLNTFISHIWSSSTLYDADAKVNRESHFRNWINGEPAISMNSLFSFFKSVKDPENGFIINRKEQVKTLSYTFIEFDHNANAQMEYLEIGQSTCNRQCLQIITKVDSCPIPNFD